MRSVTGRPVAWLGGGGPAEIVGKNVSFHVERLDGESRWFNGYVSRFAYLGTDDRAIDRSDDTVENIRSNANVQRAYLGDGHA